MLCLCIFEFSPCLCLLLPSPLHIVLRHLSLYNGTNVWAIVISRYKYSRHSTSHFIFQIKYRTFVRISKNIHKRFRLEICFFHSTTSRKFMPLEFESYLLFLLSEYIFPRAIRVISSSISTLTLCFTPALVTLSLRVFRSLLVTRTRTAVILTRAVCIVCAIWPIWIRIFREFSFGRFCLRFAKVNR